MPNEELKPCPFCGSKSVLLTNWGLWRAWCTNCKANASDFLTQKEAKEAWNTRANPKEIQQEINREEKDDAEIH